MELGDGSLQLWVSRVGVILKRGLQCRANLLFIAVNMPALSSNTKHDETPLVVKEILLSCNVQAETYQGVL